MAQASRIKHQTPASDSDRLKAGELRHFVVRGIAPAEAERLVCLTLEEAAKIAAPPADYVPLPEEIQTAAAGIRRGWRPSEFESRWEGGVGRVFERSA